MPAEVRSNSGNPTALSSPLSRAVSAAGVMLRSAAAPHQRASRGDGLQCLDLLQRQVAHGGGLPSEFKYF